MEITDMTPEEHDDYCRLVRARTGDDEGELNFRAAEFDRRCVACGLPKEQFSKFQKSSIMLQLFDSTLVEEDEEKNS